MASFRAQVLRFTAFLPQPPDEASQLWSSLTGGQPDVSENRLKENLQRTAGAWRSAQLEVQLRPGRLDLVAVPRTSQVAQSLDFGFAKVEFNEFIKVIRPVFPRLEKVHRVAMGGVLLLKADSQEHSVDLFSNHTGIELGKILGCGDLMFRCNRRHELGTGLYYNRIRTWQCMSVQSFTGTIAPTIFQSEDFYLQLDLDHSTPVDSVKDLDVSSIADELAALFLGDVSGGE